MRIAAGWRRYLLGACSVGGPTGVRRHRTRAGLRDCGCYRPWRGACDGVRRGYRGPHTVLGQQSGWADWQWKDIRDRTFASRGPRASGGRISATLPNRGQFCCNEQEGAAGTTDGEQGICITAGKRRHRPSECPVETVCRCHGACVVAGLRHAQTQDMATLNSRASRLQLTEIRPLKRSSQFRYG